MKNYWKHSIFIRLIVVFMLIVLPLYGIGIGIYRGGVQTIRQNITHSMLSSGAYYMQSLEKDIQRIRILQYELLNDEDLRKLIYANIVMNEYDKVSSVIRLQNRLLTIKHSSPLIENIKVYMPAMNRSIETTGVVTLPQGVMEPYLQLPVDKNNHKWFIHPQGGLSLATTLTALDSQYISHIAAVIDISFSIEEMKSSLSQLDSNESGGSLLIHQDNDQTLAYSGQFKDINAFSLVQTRATNATNTTNATNVTNGTNGDGSGLQGARSIVMDGQKWLLISIPSTELDVVLYKYVSENKSFAPIRQYRIWFWLLSLAALAMIILYSFVTYKQILTPLTRLVRAFRNTQNDRKNIQISYKYNDEFGFLYLGFNEMVRMQQEMIKQVYEQKILTQKAELKKLQAQINPHFLYNSFFILHRMIASEENEKAVAFSEQLGQYFRFITRNTKGELSLQDEVTHARLYAEIQRLRFSKRLSVDFGELPLDFADIIVPNLIIQPLIENVFEHGLRNKELGGVLRIRFDIVSPDKLMIQVEDNGNELTDANLSQLNELLNATGDETEVTGMVNIHRRVLIFLGGSSGLTVDRSELGGLRITIWLDPQRLRLPISESAKEEISHLPSIDRG